jgi:hypothetical protein
MVLRQVLTVVVQIGVNYGNQTKDSTWRPWVNKRALISY